MSRTTNSPSALGRLRSRRGAVLAAGAAAAVLLLSACGPDQAGSAAVYGESRITDDALTQRVNTLLDFARVALPNQTIQNDARINRSVLTNMLLTELVESLAAKRNVTVSNGDIDAVITDQLAQVNGDSSQFLDYYAQQSLWGMDAIRASIKLDLMVQGVAMALVPADTAREQVGVAVRKAIADEAAAQNLTVSPRFGMWDSENLQVVAPEDTISSPAPLLDGNGPSLIPSQ